MQYLITKEFAERLKDHLAGAIDEVDEADALYQELQSLPVLEGETIGYAEHLRLAIAKVCEGFTLHDGARKILETALFTHPAPFTPITADDVTDDMLKKYDKLCYDEASTPQQHLAAVLNLGAKK